METTNESKSNGDRENSAAEHHSAINNVNVYYKELQQHCFMLERKIDILNQELQRCSEEKEVESRTVATQTDLFQTSDAVHVCEKCGHTKSKSPISVKGEDDVELSCQENVRKTEDTKVEVESSDLVPETSESISDMLKQTAEAALQQTGYVYDEQSGLYYDYKSGYYYDPVKCLYYEPKTGTYYYFNHDTNQYVLHSQVDLSAYHQHQQYYTQLINSVPELTNKSLKRARKKAKALENAQMLKDGDDASSSNKKSSKKKKKKGKGKQQGSSRKHGEGSEKDKAGGGLRASSNKGEKKAVDSEAAAVKKKVVDEADMEDGEVMSGSEGSSEEGDTSPVGSSHESDSDKELNESDQEVKRISDLLYHSCSLSSDSQESHKAERHKRKKSKKHHHHHRRSHEQRRSSNREVVNHVASDGNRRVAMERKEIPVIDVIDSGSDELMIDDDEGSGVAVSAESELDQSVSCIRAVVLESDCLPLGSLHLVTAVTGARLGSDPNTCDICLPSDGVAKEHASIRYNSSERQYEIRDLAGDESTPVYLNGDATSPTICVICYFLVVVQ